MCSSRGMLVERQTDRQTQPPRYFAFPIGGEVIRLPMHAVTDRIFWQTSKTNWTAVSVLRPQHGDHIIARSARSNIPKFRSFVQRTHERIGYCTRARFRQEAQLSPRDRAIRHVSWNLANCHATVQKLLVRQVLNKSKLWSWRVKVGRCVINMCTQPWRIRVTFIVL